MKGKSLILLVFAFLFAACDDEKPRLPESKGQPAELLVVMPSKLMHGETSDTLNTVVDCDAPGLGSSERIFRTMTIGAKGYEKVYKLMHTQLHIEIDPSAKTPTLGVAHDVHARPQLQMLIRAASERDLQQFLSLNRKRIQRIILDFQLDRQATLLQKKYSKKVSDDLRRMGFDARVPSDIQSTKPGKNFLWASSNRGGDKDINFVLYTVPWQGENICDTALFVQRRDSVMQVNVPGSQPGQYMTTTRGQTGRPVLWPELRMIAGVQQFEVRGLWEMKNGFMGGPFVSLVRVDSVRQQVVITEGFVFSPNSSKRDLLRSLESALRTIKHI